MGYEANIGSIQALEKQIEEGRGDIIKLKRTRNSFLNISTRVPPEILAYIFVWCIFREPGRSLNSPHFDGLRRGSYNFLLVCHHWFKVASSTPELWSFWGNTVEDWKECHHRSGVAPLDLILCGEYNDDNTLDGPLREALRRRVMQNTIRQVHLMTGDRDALISIVALLTPDDEGGQNENIESIILVNERFAPVDVLLFFTSSLSRLHLLILGGNFWISSWDRLTSRTTLLTAMDLDFSGSSPSPTPTTSQLFSILASNPNIQELRLSDSALPDDAHGSTLKVPLRNLKMLSLSGEFRHLFELLHRLVLPQALDEMHLCGSNPTLEDISQTFAPYIRDYFQRDIRFQDKLEIFSFSSLGFISIRVGVVRAQATAPAPWASFMVGLSATAPLNVPERFLVRLIAPFPREPVVSFDATLDFELPEELLLTMPNIETLRIRGVKLSKGFLQPDPDGPHAGMKLLPSLRSLSLKTIYLDDGNWGDLTTYLGHQTSDGQIISLRMSGNLPYIPSEVVDEIKGLVGEFVHEPGTRGELLV